VNSSHRDAERGKKKKHARATDEILAAPCHAEGKRGKKEKVRRNGCIMNPGFEKGEGERKKSMGPVLFRSEYRYGRREKKGGGETPYNSETKKSSRGGGGEGHV